MNLRRVLALAYKEWSEIVRDRLFFVLAFIVPPTMMTIVGYGVSMDTENIPILFIDQDNSPTSRELVAAYEVSRYFNVKGFLDGEHEIHDAFVRNRARAVVIIPPGFGQSLLADRPAAIQTIMDAGDASNVNLVKNYIVGISASFRPATAPGSPGTRVQARYLYNDALKTRWFISPGGIMISLMMGVPLLTAVGVVRERESGSILNVYSSTLTRLEFIVGKSMPYVGIALLNVGVLFFMATALFGVPFRGSIVAFVGVSAVFVTCVTLLGVVFSLIVRTQMSAVLLTQVATMTPTMEYSGVITPLSSLSAEQRVQSYLLPGTYYNRAVQGSFLKGLQWDALLPDLAALLVYTAVLFGIGLCLFSKRPKG
jgi:ABC-2 type transport system permease protein/ribosome-dependent ATPase